MTPRVELLCAGTELLEGRVNTHPSRLASSLLAAGLGLSRETSLPDDRETLAAEIRAALSRSDAVIVTGGLGPTFDDISREAAADALGRRLLFKAAICERLRARFRRHGLSMPAKNRRQAYVIPGARVLPNATGSAPGQLISLPGPKTLVLLPGPFSELWPMFKDRVLPHLRKTHAQGIHVERLVLRLAGIPESLADERLDPVRAATRNGVRYTILSGDGEVEFFATATAASGAAAAAAIKTVRRRALQAVGDKLVAEGEVSFEEAVGRALKARRLTLAVAESCTAGLLGARLTRAAGSSAYFLGGVLAYSNDVKTGLLGVSPRTLARHGAVSRPCAQEMAEGARRAVGASVGVAVTGIAGPDGGTRAKPVGLVHIAVAGPGPGRWSSRRLLGGDRDTVRRRAVGWALEAVLRRLR